MKKLLLADDHQIILDGLQKIFEESPYAQVVGLVNNGLEVLTFLKHNDVDVLCMDIEMPGLDGVETSRQVKKNYPGTKILILSMYNQPQFVKELVQVGIEGFVKKDSGKMELLLAIEQLASGNTYYSQHFAQALVQAQKNDIAAVKLTSREKEILNLLSEGLNTKQIADNLFISPYTVETHRKHLLNKFNVNNTTSLIKEAARLGQVSL